MRLWAIQRVFLSYEYNREQIEIEFSGIEYDLIWISLIGNYSFLSTCQSMNLMLNSKIGLGLQDLTSKNYRNYGLKFWKGLERSSSSLGKYLRAGLIGRVERKVLCEL